MQQYVGFVKMSEKKEVITQPKKNKIMKNKIILTILATLLIGTSHQASATVFVDMKTLTDAVSVPTSSGTVKVNALVLKRSMRLTRDKVWIVNCNLIVPTGKTLYVEQGTLLRFERPTLGQGTGTEKAVTPADPGAIVVARGGRLVMAGTADAPITCTTMDDPWVPGGIETIPVYENKGVVAATGIINSEVQLKDGGTLVRGTVGVGEYEYTGGTLTGSARSYSKTFGTSGSIYELDGQWGGIVMCGYATLVKGYSLGVNARTTGINEPTINATTGATSGSQLGVEIVEGMAGFSAYSFGGGDEDTDNSGSLSFVNVNYGGYIIASDKELNSYSFYGVGVNTNLDFLADWNNADDSYEFWGGAALLKHAISIAAGDDGFDTDQGYCGGAQNYVQIQNNRNDTDGTTLSARSAINIGDSLTETDGSEKLNSSVPYTVWTMANATLIGRGYNAGGFSATSQPNTGPNFKDNGSGQMFNSIIMDSAQGAMSIVDATVPTISGHEVGSNGYDANQANDSCARFAGVRSSGGFDASGKADDLVTAQTGAPSTPDGLFKNVWFYRNGLAKSSYAANAKYASLAALNADIALVGANAAYTASDANLFPTSADRKERNGNADGTAHRANIQAVIDTIKASGNYNVFNTSPGLIVPTAHRLSGIDLRPTTAAAKTLANSSIPNRRGINPNANYAGAVRDNMWMRVWSYADNTVGMFTGTQIVPDVSVSVNGSGNPVVTFGGEDTVSYSVERSVDGRSFVPINYIASAAAGNNSYTDTSRVVGSTAVLYRVIAQ